MRVGVVGPTGVLGQALIPLLIQHGHTVRALARSFAKVIALFPQVTENVECDLLTVVTQDLIRMLDGCDAVVHIATAIPRDFSIPHAMDRTAWLRTEGVRKLLDATLSVGASRYLQQSITMAYPDHGDAWITEELPLDDSPRRASVAGPVIAMEQMIRAIPTDRLVWCILRGGAFVGSGTFQEDRIAELKSGQAVVPCDGHNYQSMIHVADIAAACAAAIDRAPGGFILNIVAEPLRAGDYTDRLADAVSAPRPRRDTGLACPPSWRCSNRAARDALGWQPEHSLFP